MTDSLMLNIILFVCLILFVVVTLRFIEDLFRIRFGPDKSIEKLQRQIDTFKDRINELEQFLKDERRERELERTVSQNKVRTLEAQVIFLTEQLQQTIKDVGVLEQEAKKLRSRAQDLEMENNLLRANVSPLTKMPSFPLLHIAGDKAFGEQDRIQLNRANVPYRTLIPNGKHDIEDEFQRRREDNSEYWWILVSAHGSKDGIYLGHELAEPAWWNKVISRSTQMIVLANCDGPEVGDALAGIAERVIVMYGAIPSDDAAAFVLALFRSKMKGNSTDDAFSTAITQVPQIASFVDIRRS